DHLAVAVEGGVVEARTGVIEAGRDGVDLGAFLQQQRRGLDPVVHAGVDERVVDDVLWIGRPAGACRLQPLYQRSGGVGGRRVAEGPVETTRLGLQAAVGVEESVDQV